MFSSTRTPAVSVYPDSDKIGVWPGDEQNALVFRRENGRAVVGWRGRLGPGLTSAGAALRLVAAE